MIVPARPPRTAAVAAEHNRSARPAWPRGRERCLPLLPHRPPGTRRGHDTARLRARGAPCGHSRALRPARADWGYPSEGCLIPAQG